GLKVLKTRSGRVEELPALKDLQAEVESAWSRLKLDEVSREEASLREDMAGADFWNDTQVAQIKAKRQSKLASRIEPWADLRRGIAEMIELAETNDASLKPEIAKQLENLKQKFESLKDELKFSGPYDGNDVIMTIHAGAGGTDAQDWAAMLLRMYVRWAEKKGVEAAVIDESAGN